MTDSLVDFLTQHAKPYDSKADTYRRPSFAKPVKAGKTSATYNAHSYHTKVPPEGIVPYIEHYTDPTDLVLDPFCGSGMTGVAALMSGRTAILNDLSPAAEHIARNYTTSVDAQALRQAFEAIKISVNSEFNWLYKTICDRCGSPALIEYIIWSDIFRCDRCSDELELWKLSVDLEKGTLIDELTCPNCGKKNSKSKLERITHRPVMVNYSCATCKPSRSLRNLNETDWALIKEIDSKNIPYWYPTAQFGSDWEMWRGAHRDLNITDVSKFYTKRNLWALASLWHHIGTISEESVRDQLRFAFTAMSVKLASKMSNLSIRGPNQINLAGQLPGTLYVPSIFAERNVFGLWEDKINQVIGYAKTVTAGKQGLVKTLVGSATDLPMIQTDSIDYVFTDPPFGSNIFYSDLNYLWEVWFENITKQEYEAVVHVKHKNKNTFVEYSILMVDSFKEIYRVLKPGRWASIVFHNSDDRIWQLILDAATKSGLELAEINAFDKVQLSFKGMKGQKGEERVTNKDIVLNLRKPRPSDDTSTNAHTRLAESEQRVLETVAEFLKTSPVPSERTLQHIWNHVLYGMIREGIVDVSMASLEEMLAYHYQTFKMVDGRYYLRGEAVVGGNVFNLQTDTDALTWLSSVLSDQLLTTGEIIPLWQKEIAHLTTVDAGRLDRLLEQNFWQDKKTGRWRNPTSEEREKMNAQVDLSAQAHLRVVHRYIEGDRDRQPDDHELSAWIRFCYSREFYSEAAVLFEHINESQLDPEDYKTIKKMASVAKLKRK